MRVLNLSIVVVMVSAIAGCGQRNQYVAPPIAQVTVAQPIVKDVVDYLEFTGSTRATDVVDIRARVNGYLKKIEFADGAMVNEGDLLFLIEPEPFEVALTMANARLQKAEAVYGLAEAELKRTEPLVTQGALSKQELDLKKADLATAKAGVSEAKSAIRQAELNLAYTKVLAPIKGRISRHMVDVGNLVQAEQTVLTRLESYQPIHAYFTVSESEMVRLMTLAKQKKISRDDLKAKQIHLGLTGETGFPHPGLLDFTELGIEPGTGTQMQRGIFPNKDQSLVPGMFVRVQLQVGDPAPKLMVSERALAADQRGAYLLVVNEKDQNKVEQRPVKFGVAIDGRRVIESGIQPGDWVIINGLQRARPGAPVEPQKLPTMPGDPERSAPQTDPKLATKPAADKPKEKPQDVAKSPATRKTISEKLLKPASEKPVADKEK
ncbi:MAG: efflux RND transporter periplasmic adaptor subunit [Planctomycetes bacterium]|nr:efflux RND transporter periplasmic adaptor subunit [Planctomycetota bacterium]